MNFYNKSDLILMKKVCAIGNTQHFLLKLRNTNENGSLNIYFVISPFTFLILPLV